MLAEKYFPTLIIIIVEIYKAPTLRLKALNKQSITRMVHIEMENFISNKNVHKEKKEKKS